MLREWIVEWTAQVNGIIISSIFQIFEYSSFPLYKFTIINYYNFGLNWFSTPAFEEFWTGFYHFSAGNAISVPGTSYTFSGVGDTTFRSLAQQAFNHQRITRQSWTKLKGISSFCIDSLDFILCGQKVELKGKTINHEYRYIMFNFFYLLLCKLLVRFHRSVWLTHVESQYTNYGNNSIWVFKTIEH